MGFGVDTPLALSRMLPPPLSLFYYISLLKEKEIVIGEGRRQ
jgi:hypothetical protein